MKSISLLCLPIFFFFFAQAQQTEVLAPGVWKYRYGNPEEHLPSSFKYAADEKAMAALSAVDKPPFMPVDFKVSYNQSGTLIETNMEAGERFYGFGMQTNSFEQSGMRREIRINSKTIGNIGFGHASMPFYISSRGYGIIINSSRYVTFYMGSQTKLSESVRIKDQLGNNMSSAASPADLYNRSFSPSKNIEIEVEGTKGVEIILIAGPTMMDVIRRYNLFSGGGSLPALWGLGFKYRAKSDFNEQEVLKFSSYFREKEIPCDMLGIEPGWHSAAYSCSYSWNPIKFSNPDSLLTLMHDRHYKLNLWEHAYVHPSAPFFDKIVPYSGDYAVWKGAVPDFILDSARSIFANYHRQHLIDKGIAAFKLDECDAAYYDEAGGEWSFPDIAKFPSGLDGIQMRQLFGRLYQQTLWDEYHKANKRTMFEVRASYLFASPIAAALYSDMYDQREYIRMICNSAFAGVNWSPEVRQSKDSADLLRRMQTSLMSAHMNVDCWFLRNLPWQQMDREKNNRGELLPNAASLEQKAKKLIELRMQLVPYLYNAFAEYHFEGIPAFRPLVLDYPNDKNVWKIDDEYMMGKDLLCAPYIDGSSTRDIYLPEGEWYDFNSHKKYEGGQSYSITMTLDQLPIFVRSGTLLPLADPVQHIEPDTRFQITCYQFGENAGTAMLMEDNGIDFSFEKGDYNRITLSFEKGKVNMKRVGAYRQKRYILKESKLIQ